MKVPRVLVVEDNAVTRKVFRLALAAAGYHVREAEDGRSALELTRKETPDLVLLDLHLPDIDGIDLAQQLRAGPLGESVPIVAVSGFLSRLEQAHSGRAGFTDYLFKPVEPSRLVERVRQLLVPPAARTRIGEGQLVLAVNDDPVELKLLRVQLKTLGFRVVTAGDGLEARRLIQRLSPQAVVSDVLMPRMDGFTLCQTIRRDPVFAKLPVVLISAAYVDEADRTLALASGASAYLIGSASLEELSAAVVKAISDPVPASADQAAELPTDAYLERAIQQVGRQAQLNRVLVQRVTFLEGELTIAAGLAGMLAREQTLDAFLEETLSCSLGAGGLSAGAIYLRDAADRLALQTQVGYGDKDRDGVAECFGCAEFFLDVLAGDEPLLLRSAMAPDGPAAKVLASWRANSMLIAPLSAANEHLGVFVIASADTTIDPEVVQFVRNCGHHAAQAVRVARA